MISRPRLTSISIRYQSYLQAQTMPVSASGLVGQVSVIDSDTLGIHGTRIRLWEVSCV